MKRQIVGDTKTESGGREETNEPTILPAFARSIVTQKTKRSVVVLLNVIIDWKTRSRFSINIEQISRKKSLISYSYLLTRANLYDGNVTACDASALCRPLRRALQRDDVVCVLVGHAIGEFIGRIQRRVGSRIRSDAGGKQTAYRDGTHRPIHVYGSWSICRDHRWKLSGISFNLDAEMPSCAVAGR